MGKKDLPYYTVYPGDEEKDPAISSLSLEEYGMYCRLRNYMANCEPYGHLKVNGKVILMDKMAVMVRVNLNVAERLVNCLLEIGVLSRKADGTVYCEDMVRKNELRLKRAAGGASGGNPALKKKPLKVNLMVNDDVNQKCENETVIDNEYETEIVDEQEGVQGEDVPASPMPTGDVERTRAHEVRYTRASLLAVEDALEVFLVNGVCAQQRQTVVGTKPALLAVEKAHGMDVALRGWLEAFNRMLLQKMIVSKHLGDYSDHFANWMNLNYKPGIDPKILNNGNNGKPGGAGANRIPKAGILQPGDDFFASQS